MITPGIRVFGRLSQLTIPCLESRRLALSPWSSERVAVFYNTTLAGRDTVSSNGKSLIAPIVRRTYATAKPVSRPKAHTGRTTTSPRKKAAPKTAAPKTAAPKTAAPKTAVSKTAAATKPAAAKKSTKPKPKPKAKAKKATAKPKPKPKRKVLTEKQKAKLDTDKERAGLQMLKGLALSPPKRLPSTSWTVFSAEAIREGDSSKGISGPVKAAALQYRNLTPEQLEHYNHIANENKAKTQANYRKWLEPFHPVQIRQANNARAALTRSTKKGWRPLKDERQVKSFRNAYNFFFAERMESGDFHGIKIPEAAKLIGREFKALPAHELKKYQDMAAQDMERYVHEQKAVYNLDVKRSPSPSP